MNQEATETQVDEHVVLSKFEGDGTQPETEFERLTISNGTVISHDVIENGEVAGPVEEDNLTGIFVGKMTESAKEVE